VRRGDAAGRAADGNRRRALRRLAAALVVACAAGWAVPASASAPAAPARRAAFTPSREQRAFLDSLERRTFLYFWERSDARTGLTPDRAPSPSFVSVGAMGFALSAYPIGAERGYVTRAAALERTLVTLRFLWRANQDSTVAGAAGYRGFFYHFLQAADGTRFENVELSSMDTALLMAGVLFCEQYFERRNPRETEVRALAESLYRRVDWKWLQVRPPTLCLGWSPEHGPLPYDWRGYNETMLAHILAMGSPTHAVGPELWPAFTRDYHWGTFRGQEYLGFAPLFGHQYTHCWLDLRGIRDGFMRAHGIDYFENSRRATLAQRQYAIDNPGGFTGYGPDVWGLTACDGPLDDTVTIGGRVRAFRTYAARGASFTEVNDDGTLCPSAAGGSIAFTPELSIRALMTMRHRYGAALYSRYGFLDAFNPTLRTDGKVHHGHVVPGVGWFDTDYLGIDEGPILLMIENWRSGLPWRAMRRNPHVVRGLRAAGFRGGWLAPAAAAR